MPGPKRIGDITKWHHKFRRRLQKEETEVLKRHRNPQIKAKLLTKFPLDDPKHFHLNHPRPVPQ